MTVTDTGRVRVITALTIAVAGLVGVLSLSASASPSNAAQSAPAASTTLGPWAVDTAPTPAGSWYAVTYAQNKWVAVGHSAEVATSPDGVTWTTNAVTSGSWQSLAYGNGEFIALSSTNADSHEMMSSDGTNWTNVAGPSGQWTGLTFGMGRFVAVSANGLIATSTNGQDWTTTFSRRFDDFTSVAFGNGRFIAVDANQGDTLLSTDAVHWAFYPSSMAGIKWGAVTYGDGTFVALDGAGLGYVGSTVLGASWNLYQFSPAQKISGVTFGCGSFVADGQATSSANNFLLSATAATWATTPVPVDPSANWTAVGYGAGRFVAVDDTGSIATSVPSANCSQVIPTSPQQVSGNIHNHEVWTYMHPPVSQGTAAVSRYRVTITNGTTTKYCYAPVFYEPNCIIKGLANHVVYQVTAQSYNRFGYSVPTDPQFVIPVASPRLSAWAEPVVSSSSPVSVQLTGVAANSLGIYPVTIVSVHVGTHVVTCRPNPFGQCLISAPNPHTGSFTLFATYTGYGRSYRSATIRIINAVVSTSSTNVGVNSPVSVTIRGGIGKSRARVSLGSSTQTAALDRSGAGTFSVNSPMTPGTYTLSVIDAGVLVETTAVVVHA